MCRSVGRSDSLRTDWSDSSDFRPSDFPTFRFFEPRPSDSVRAFALLLLQVQSPPSHEEALRHRSGLVPRSITATFADPAPRIDGRLDDPIWSRVEPQAGFRRDVPSDGKPATQDIEVRMVYDRDALYVGARLLDDRPDLVSRRLNRRDSFSNFNDVFFVLIDAY